MVELDKSNLSGKGLHRECYRHPENETLCIKVVVSGNDDETRREQAYYRHIEKRRISWDMIPRFHGNIETTLGRGAVFDLISDHDGEVSKTLEYYLSSNEETDTHYDGLSSSLYQLKDYLLQQRIITMTLKPKNISCKRMTSGSFRLFIIDNIGNSDYIQICNYSKYFAGRKILRKWKDFERRMLNTYKHNKSLHRMLSSSRG